MTRVNGSAEKKKNSRVAKPTVFRGQKRHKRGNSVVLFLRTGNHPGAIADVLADDR